MGANKERDKCLPSSMRETVGQNFLSMSHGIGKAAVCLE